MVILNGEANLLFEDIWNVSIYEYEFNKVA